jgi:hypothetical protein
MVNGKPKLICDMEYSLLDAKVSIEYLAFAADGTLYVVTENSNTHSCTSVWTIRGLSSLLPKHHSLVASMDVDADLSISINGFDLKLHKSFAAVRCPAFLAHKTALSQPVDHAALDAFRRFLYSDLLPDTLTSFQLMGMAVRVLSCLAGRLVFNANLSSQFLCQSADLQLVCLDCFKKLEAIQPDPDPQKAAAELIGLYCYSLDLANFIDGEKVAMYLLQKHRKLIALQTAQIQALLGRHIHRFLDLVTMFIANAEASSPLETLQCS